MSPLSISRSIVVAGFAMLLASSCANQIPPAGGPEDAEGPRVIYVYPEPFSLNVETDRIEIEFDEYVDKRSAAESIFISPPIDDIDVEWWGTSVEISFESTLLENTTYVVSIGTDVTDLEPTRKNRMSSAFSFPFSTGNTIDRGLIAGTVIPVDPKDELGGVMVYAYRLPTGRADTLNVSHAAPTYVTQAGRDGSFVFPHIRFGTYFILSLRDASRNIVYDVEEDEFAVPTSPVRLSQIDTAHTGLILQLAKEDTTGPRLTTVTPIDRNHLRVEFSEAIDTSRQRRPTAIVRDTLTGDARTVYTVTPVLPGLKQALLTTDFLDPDAPYSLLMDGVYDPSGNRAVPGTTTLTFTSNATMDTLAPVLRSVSVRDSSTDRSVTEEILYTFSEPIGLDRWTADRVRLQSLPDSSTHTVSARWVTESILGIRPEGEMRSYSWYQVTLLIHGLRDWKLEDIADSISRIRFRTEDIYDTGTIEGTVNDAVPFDTAGAVFIVARPVNQKADQVMQVRGGSDGRFLLRRLRPGTYSLYAFKDRNGNMTFDPGKPVPYRPAERRSAWTDTLKVRSRWPLEGVRITIP